jgi:outer membrane protein TolC
MPLNSRILIGLFVFGALYADDAVRLEELTQEALRANPEILAAQKRYEAARQRPSLQSSLPDPMFSLSYNSSGSPRPFAGIGSEPTANAGFMISQEFPFPGKRKLRGEIASKEAEAEFQQYQAVELNVLSRLKQAYHRLHHAYAMIEVMERNRDLLRKFLRISEARYAVGKAAQQDIFKAQTQLSILETRIEKMQQEERSREAEINSLLARPPDSPLARPADIPPAQLNVTLEELFTHARQNAPTLRREEKVVQRTELAVNLARKDYYPDYTLSAGYYNMGSMPSMYMARMDFKLPAYFWRKQRAEVAEQAGYLSQARHNLEAANQVLGFRIKDDYLMAETSYRLMNMYANTVIPQSALALQSSLISYETGAVDFLSVLTNFITTLDYELNYHEEMLSYFLAVTRLEEMTGTDL